MSTMTKEEVLSFLQIQNSTLDIIQESYCLFSIDEGDNKVFPSYQFTDKGLNAYSAVISATFKKASFTGEEIHEWFNTPLSELNGYTPLEYGLDDKVRMIASVHADISML